MLLRHLPSGVDATILTAAVEDYKAYSPLGMPIDESRFQGPQGVHRIGSSLPEGLFRMLVRCRLVGAARWMFVPDMAGKWRRRVVESAIRLHRRNPFDVIFSTAPPFSAALAGRDCTRRLGLPWVSDLRDLWTGYLLGAWPTRLHFRREQALERSVLREAAITIMVTPGSREWMLRHHLFVSPERITSVTNGYLASEFPPASLPVPGKLLVVHTGSLFEARGSGGRLRRLARGRSFCPRQVDTATHSLVPLLAAMERLGDPRVELRHVGPPPDGGSQARLANSPVRSQVQLLGYRPHSETLAELVRADAAYLGLATVRDEPRNELVPQKTYEYLGARCPVLAPIQDGDARDFLDQAGTGLCTPPYDEAGLAEALRALVRAKIQGRPAVSPREDFIRRFEWSQLADRLLGILDQAASRVNVCVG
jgi:glycosyltransferase involved in cell wall biosynthesis